MVEADVVQRGLAALVIEAVPLPPGDALDRNQEEGLQSSLREGWDNMPTLRQVSIRNKRKAERFLNGHPAKNRIACSSGVLQKKVFWPQM